VETNSDKDLTELTRLSKLWDTQSGPSLLVHIIESSDDFEVLDQAAILASDKKVELAKEALFKRLVDPKTKEHRSTLLFGCSAFDCSNQLEVLVHIVINDTYGAAIEALHLIQNNCPLAPVESINRSLDLIEDVINMPDISEERVELLEVTGNFLASILPHD